MPRKVSTSLELWGVKAELKSFAWNGSWNNREYSYWCMGWGGVVRVKAVCKELRGDGGGGGGGVGGGGVGGGRYPTVLLEM